MAIPMLLGGVTKGLLGGAAKKAVGGGKKNKDAKKFVAGKDADAIVKQEKQSVVKKSDIIPKRQTKFISLPSSVYRYQIQRPIKTYLSIVLRNNLIILIRPLNH